MHFCDLPNCGEKTFLSRFSWTQICESSHKATRWRLYELVSEEIGCHTHSGCKAITLRWPTHSSISEPWDLNTVCEMASEEIHGGLVPFLWSLLRPSFCISSFWFCISSFWFCIFFIKPSFHCHSVLGVLKSSYYSYYWFWKLSYFSLKKSKEKTLIISSHRNNNS